MAKLARKLQPVILLLAKLFFKIYTKKMLIMHDKQYLKKYLQNSSLLIFPQIMAK